MANKFWSGNIGAIPLLDTDGEDAGFDLTGAGAFVSDWTGVSQPGGGGLPHTQYSLNPNGRVIELKFLHIPQTLAQALIDLLEPLIPTGNGVACSFTDDFQTINKNFKPSMPNWIERGLPDGDYINDFILRLVNIP